MEPSDKQEDVNVIEVAKADKDDEPSAKPEITENGKDEKSEKMTDDNSCVVVVKGNRCKDLQEGCKEVSTLCRNVRDTAMSFSCRACVQSTCTVAKLKKRLPILQWLPKYRCPEFQGDLIAGLTVGLTVIPQGLAYAQVAELPPQYGLYSAFMGCFVYCLLGTSKDITLGPTAIMSLMTAEFGHGSIPLSILLTFMSGLVQLFMGVFSLGFMVDFIPFPVINSFTVAAAITIACGQIKKWLGIHVESRSFIPQLYWTFAKIKETKIWDFVLGLVCLIVLFTMKKVKNMKWRDDSEMSRGCFCWKKFVWILTTARNAVVVLIASGLAAGLTVHDIDVFSLTGNITSGLPPFEPPPFQGAYLYPDSNDTTSGLDMLAKIGGGIGIVPLMGVVESIAIGNAFARRNKYKIDANQELIAIGASNLIGSFVGSYPVTGSFSRTAVNSQSGVRTPAGGLWTGALILLALGLLTPLFKYIPNAALAAVIIMAVLDMVSFSLLKKLWRVKKMDLLPWFVCFILSFALGIEWGIIGGVGIAMLLLLYPWARPSVQVVKELPRSPHLPTPDVIEREVTVVKLNQGLLYPGVEYVRERIITLATQDGLPKSVVLDCSHLASVDYSAIQGFQGLTDDFEQMKVKLILTNLQPDVLDVIQKANITKLRYCNVVEEAVQTIIEEGEQEDNPRQALIGKQSSSERPTKPRSPTGSTGAYGTTSSTPPRSPTSDHPTINEVSVDMDKSV